MEKEIINIVLSSSRLYLPLALMSMSSCLLAASDPSKLSFYLLGDQLTIGDEALVRKTLVNLQARADHIHVLECHDSLSQFKLSAETLSRGLPATTFLRALIPSVLPATVDSILYVDADTLWLCDACQFAPILNISTPIAWAHDVVAECGELCMHGRISLPHIRQWYSINRLPFILADYPNAGVLVMNLRMLREDNLLDRVSQFLERYQGMPTVDQDVFYSLYRTEATLLPQWMNFQWFFPFAPPRSCILHFAGGQHPCQNNFDPHNTCYSGGTLLLQHYWQKIFRPFVGTEIVPAWDIPLSKILLDNIWIWAQFHFPWVFHLVNHNLIKRAKVSEAKRLKLNIRLYDVYVRYPAMPISWSRRRSVYAQWKRKLKQYLRGNNKL